MHKTMGMLKTKEGVQQLKNMNWHDSMENLPDSSHLSFGVAGVTRASGIGSIGGLGNRGSILPLNGAQVRKTIRGGHGSMYMKGG